MLVKISDLDRGRRHFHFTMAGDEVYEAVGLRSDVEPGIKGEVDVDAEKVEGAVTLSGLIELELRGVCSRCAEDFDTKTGIPWKLTLLPRSQRPGPEFDDVETGYYSGDRIDLMKLARESIGLLFPEILLCSPDCRGVCPGCGVNMNIEKCRCP